MNQSKKSKPENVIIKKYANRRLYDTSTSSYVTLEYLAGLVKEGINFVVQDAKTGEDLTHSVLTQIIVEQEAKGYSLLPDAFLRQLISLYGDSLQWAVPQYLEQTMQAFAKNQDQMRKMMQTAFSGVMPLQNLEEIGKKNVELMQQAMRMFSPFPTNAEKTSEKTDPLDEMQRSFRELQEKVNKMGKK